MLAAIPYTTFPDFELGPITIRSFGTIVAVGILLGSWLAARENERWGIDRDDTYKLAIRMVVWGVIGSRVTWVISHTDQIDSPIDLIALWEGGIQFTGGFVAAVIAGYPTFRKWQPRHRYRTIDGYAYGLTIGLAIGRLGCYSVGEHLGSTTSFFLGSRYEGGQLQEPTLDGLPVVEGMVFHQTALYEFFHLMVLFGIMSWILYVNKKPTKAGTLIGLFSVWYGIGRFLTDTLRVNDNRTLGMTGAQWGCLVLLPAGLYLLFRGRQKAEAAALAEESDADDVREPTGDPIGVDPSLSTDDSATGDPSLSTDESATGDPTAEATDLPADADSELAPDRSAD